MSLKKIIRYPIKGFNGEFLESVQLCPNLTLPGDRKYAFAKHYNNIQEDQPTYMRKTNFLALVKEEKLSLLNSELNLENKILKLKYKKEIIFLGSLEKEEDLIKLSTSISKFLGFDLEKKPRLVTDKSEYKDHSFSDIPDKAVSFINLNTVKDFEKKINQQIDYKRFRGNIIFDGIKAWEEFNWIEKKIKIGEVEFQIFRKTKRCAATEVNPQNGKRDINVPNQLYKIYGHSDLGVYGLVLNKGSIKTGDEIKI